MSHVTHPEPAHQTTGEPETPRTSWALLAVALAAQILVVLDISVVNTALPTIGRALHLESGQLPWLVTAYLMMSGGGLLLGGRIADLLSRRRVFLTGLSLFTIASVISGFADNGSQLIAARAVQGLSAALLTPSALSLITTSYAGAQRKTALAVWGAVGSLGVAAGVLLGGALTTWASWQAIFWVNIPVGVIALLVGRRVIAHDTAPRPSIRDFDFPGAVAVIGGLATLVYGISGTESHGWWSVQTVGAITASAILLVLFVRLEQRATAPLFPPHVWKLQALVSGTTVMLGVTGILVGTVFLTSIFLQTVLGFSALETGLGFLPFAFAITAGTVVARHLLDHVSPRVIACVGLLVTAGSAGWLSMAGNDAGFASRHPPRALLARAGRGHGVRPRLGDVDGRHPGLARRRRLRVLDDGPRDRCRARCRRAVSGRQLGRHPDHRDRCRRRVLGRVRGRRRHRRRLRDLRAAPDAGRPRHRGWRPPAPALTAGLARPPA